MKAEIFDSLQGLTLEEIMAFEIFINHSLPDEYKAFLQQHNGGRIQPDHFKYSHPDDDEAGSVLYRFLGLSRENYFTVENYLITYEQRVPTDFLPIATDVGGNLLCLSLRDDSYGQIYFWNHEQESSYGEEPRQDNLYFTASSINELLNICF